MNAFNYFAGAILLLPVAIHQAARLSRARGWGTVGWAGWAALGYMAVCASVAAYVVYFWLLKHMAASRLGAFSYLLPVVATVLGILLLGERITRNLVLGGALVLLGVYLTQSGPREAKLEAKYILD